MVPAEYPYLSNVWSHLTQFVVNRGSGCRLYTEDGRELLDFTSGIGVAGTGHCHPRIVAALKEQAERLIFSQINCTYHDGLFTLCDKLRTIVPPGLDRFFFSNSGAEAVEAAVKLAKHATGKPNVIVLYGSFHGRTHLTMAMTTSKIGYRLKYAPLPAGIFVAPYPYALAYGMTEEQVADFAISELDKLLHTQTDPTETACIVVEPILGEGGYVVPPDGYLRRVRELCDQNGILMVIDEIQSGFGRSGRYFAHTFEKEVLPDIMTMAKCMGSGLPISGLAYKASLGEHWITGSHGGTYCGAPMPVAAACATIDLLIEEKLEQNAALRGRQLMEGLAELQRKYSSIGQVRGRGLMVGVEFLKDGQPDPARSNAVIKRCIENSLLLLGCGLRKNVVRWIPPLICTEQDIDTALSLFADALLHTEE